MVCHDLTEAARQAVLDGCVTLLLSHPCGWMAQRLCEAMATAARTPPSGSKLRAALLFVVCTPANA